MGLPDLVFLLAALALLVAGVRVVVNVLRGRRGVASRIARRTVGVAACYLGVLVTVSVVSARRWIPLGTEQRFDDWGITIARAERTATGYRVSARVTNHGRGRAQRARDAALVLVLADGGKIVPEAAPGARSLQSVVNAGETFETSRDFAVPDGAQVMGLDVLHGAWPELFIIGDRGSILAKRPLVRLE